MTVIYITENNCKCYAVTFENNGFVQVQQFEDVSESDKNIIYSINPMETFLGKSKSCTMTALSGAFDEDCFDGNTILLKVDIENGKNKNLYFGGDMVCSFLTSDNIYEYVSNMGNNLTPYSFATGKENYYLLAPNFSFIKKDKIDYDTILKRIYVPESDLPFEKLELCKIHSNYDNIEKTNLDLKTPGLNNPETHILTHNRFKTYMVLIFADLKKAQIYKIPYRNSPYQEIEIVMSFDYLHVFGPDEDNKDENFLFEIEDKKFVHVGENVFSFETNDEIEDYFSEHGYNDVKYSFARGKENIYFMLHQKYIPIQEYENSIVKNEYKYLYKKDNELKGGNITVENDGIVEYGNDFINCKIIHSKQ